jgi:hypothetical protein
MLSAPVLALVVIVICTGVKKGGNTVALSYCIFVPKV